MTKVYWEGGAKKQEARLLVVAPVGYRTSKNGRKYYRQPAYPLTTDLTAPAKQLLQDYFDRWGIEVNHRDEKEIFAQATGGESDDLCHGKRASDLPKHGRSRRRVRKTEPSRSDPAVQTVQTPGPAERGERTEERGSFARGSGSPLTGIRQGFMERGYHSLKDKPLSPALSPRSAGRGGRNRGNAVAPFDAA
jgi:hypothetical protein